ncbi:hypothetical protein BDA96_09G111000 [Sorghum bicolor]|uniref:Uncharacterized protein n=1 Tax=Sorghum bicolor TaxID=4558 RepID=A0A921U4I9_SORBI|nr:hypothetical protein BDA96_09G111000 [Sorghum bicolor]
MSAFLNASMDMVLTWTLPTHYGCPPLPKMAWSLQAVSFLSNHLQDSERPHHRHREAVIESKMQVDKTSQLKFLLLYASTGKKNP